MLLALISVLYSFFTRRTCSLRGLKFYITYSDLKVSLGEAKIATKTTFNSLFKPNFYFIREQSDFSKPSRLKVCNVNEAFVVEKKLNQFSRTNTLNGDP